MIDTLTPATGEEVRSLGLMTLAQALRAGGVRLGTDRLISAAEALAVINISHRGDTKSGLRATLINDPADFELFDQLFDVLYPSSLRVPPGAEWVIPQSPESLSPPALRRLAEALRAAGPVNTLTRPDEQRPDARGTFAATDVLVTKDFEQMSSAELDAARRLLAMPSRSSALRRTRRYARATHGSRLDVRHLLRASASGRVQPLHWLSPRMKPREWVLLMDISGSMAVYTRMFLHFAHVVARRLRPLEAFAFATRLTRLTRHLRPLDPDTALMHSARAVSEWDGGTRIGACLAEFNTLWSRRVLARGAGVILLTDGLERGDPAELDEAVRRLSRSARELVWVNPLERSASYAPLAMGAAVLARYATRHHSAHNVRSLIDLAVLLGL